MSSSNGNGSSNSTAAALPPSRPSKRSKMRNGTFVIPATGERSRRQFTLRAPRSRSHCNGAERRPPAASGISVGQRIRAASRFARTKALAAWAWLQTDDGRQVLKCTLAYLLGTTATFWPPLSNFLGRRDGKHIAATLTVYFHPARTAGSMLEAVVIAIVAVLYAELVCVLSMGIAMASRAVSGSATPAHALVLVVCIGGGLGLVGWTKQRLNQPLVNTASTLASMAIISVITKEESVANGYFSAGKIVQMFKLLLLGISFTVAVNLLVWRVSARKVLRQSVRTAAVALSDRLSFITSGFLNGSEDEVSSPEYTQASAQYNSAYAQIMTTLREAKIEQYVLGREKIYSLDKRLIKSLETLSQAIGGLRSALQTQLTLLNEGPSSGMPPPPSFLSPEPSGMSRSVSYFSDDARDRLSVIEEDEFERRSALNSHSDPTLDKSPIFRVPSDIFALFLALLGPSMKSLAYTLSETLKENPFGRHPEQQVAVNDHLRASLHDALDLYNTARGKALRQLYRSIELGRSRSEDIQADIEEVAAACGHFSFCLQAVAEEMDAYLDVLESLERSTESPDRSWKWLRFWRHWKVFQRRSDLDAEQQPLLASKPKPIRTKSPTPGDLPKAMLQKRDSFHWDAAPHKTSILVRRFSQALLGFLRILTREDVLFGIKVGIGAVLWAMLAFIPATRPVYQHWRGEWGLLSYMIVVGMTTGASNTTGSARFIGTLIGGACACLAWLSSMSNPWLLELCTAIVALGNFYVILVLKKAPLGRISLLAYNVIVLYAYSLTQNVDDDDDDEGGIDPLIFEITYHRVVSVTLGILWGILVCRLLWPISGRKKFREGLSVLYLQLGLIWKRGPLAPLLEENRGGLEFLKEGEQTALRRYVYKLESLRESAKSEFELRGPFPNAAYGRIMHSTKHILDGMYAMRLITQRRDTLSEGESALLEITAAERMQLCQRICHVFQVLASCVMLEYPLTDAIPTIDRTRDRLLNKIYQYRKEHMEMNLRNDEDAVQAVTQERDYALLYAYTLVTAQVAAELKKIKKEIEGLFGVLRHDELLLE
ncbi:60S ribosomal protein L19 [Trichoderma reesei RUT C-30]|uniref:60S ribosomal protein L19 n=1 Tax=Hypocrea jecorina (strain ATCC 56765 / BCRC 32924 / NRRL 11460 / Rut C-30) TaxID=1344414 RepID=A0A024S9W0_HYPJR|nr:60S ribosomal protein L19 [Trichoderma reesei RUT C-30]